MSSAATSTATHKKAAAPRKPKADAAPKPATAKPAAAKKPRAKKADAPAAVMVAAVAEPDKGRKAGAKVAAKGKAAAQKPVAEVKAAASKVAKAVQPKHASARMRKAMQEVGTVARARVYAVSARYRLPAMQRQALADVTDEIVQRVGAVLGKAVLFMQHAHRKSITHGDTAEGVRVLDSLDVPQIYSAFAGGYSGNDKHGIGYINRRLRVARKSHPTRGAEVDADE
jgi:hypothetical protein